MCTYHPGEEWGTVSVSARGGRGFLVGDAVHVARHEEGQRKAARMSKESARSACRYSGESSFPSSINLCVRRRACGFACVRVCLKGSRRGRRE